jgi:tRNA-specific 2-thiouridylase
MVEFPLGLMTKTEVRAAAARAGLGVAQKRDSQEVCFIPDNDYASFVAAEASRIGLDASGDLVDTAGKVIGRHGEYYRYTIGQRRGLGVALGSSRYVVAVDAGSRAVTIGTNDDLMSHSLVAAGASWVAGVPPGDGTECTVRVRNGHEGAPGRLFTTGGGASFRVEFKSPVRAIAPGQAAVVYDGDRVLGGGWMEGRG